MQINRGDFTVIRFFKQSKALFDFFMNSRKFKEFEFRARLFRPVRVEGAQYISIRKKAIVKSDSWLIALKNSEFNPELIIGEGCSVGYSNHIASVRSVVFGKHVQTANRVYISDNLHGYERIDIPIMHQPIQFKAKVYIGDGSWIGENACIIGANIGKNCVIGANSVILSDIPDYSVAAGAPGKIVKQFNPSTKTWKSFS